ncbi:MAG: extracellular solute-binding protein [Gammaproteobacteria bacterium]|nr:extracellular solute-binding protein [Gammaproteobacteria bacterium]
MNTLDKRNGKRRLADLAGQLAARRISKRDFLKKAAALGLFAAGAGVLGGAAKRPFSLLSPAHAADEGEQSPEVTAWLKDVGKGFRGRNITIKYATEATPPSQVLSTLVENDFTRYTGIEVQVEIVPLEQVLQKLTQDVAGGLGSYDLYYLDQSWMASFSNDTVDPREMYQNQSDLAMPNYDFDDFLPPLTEGISMFRNKMVGVPFDIPIFIVMIRQDIYDKMGLQTPTTYPQYLDNARAIQAEYNGEIFGTTGQMKSGHYSLECDWTNWLWGHGGSIFGPDGKFAGNDARGIDAMEYWLRLKENMPPDVLNWTWDGEFTSMAQGLAAQVYSWGEFFPGLDNPENSKVAGLLEPVLPLQPVSLRAPAEAGHGEIPGTAHQGGSALAVSRYSKNLDAAWVFAQWGSSADMNIRVSLLGGGASPMRRSTYEDARVLAKARPGVGSTRHFAVTRRAIENHMGSEPDHPAWAEVSNGVIPVELGRFFAGEYRSPKAVMDEIAEGVDKAFARY